MPTSRINFLDVRFDRQALDDIVERLASARPGSPYAYVVTPNVDHIVKIHREPELKPLYDDASFCLCDSRVLRLLARLSGIRLPLVAGSDLTSRLFESAIRAGDKVALIGGSSQSLKKLSAKYPKIDFVQHRPAMNLRHDAGARRQAAEFAAAAAARFTFLAVGSPQQELIAHEIGSIAGAGGVALCVGASLEFLTGEQRRAPRLMQALGIEWAHRLAMNPRRMWRRYLVEGMAIFPIYLSWRRRTRAGPSAGLLLAATALAVVGFYGAKSYTQRGGMGSTSNTLSLPPATSAASINLPPPDLLRPLSPEEASKENADRPFVNRPDSAASRFVLQTDADDHERALNCLTQAVYYEAAGEGTDGGRAVAQVVLNRMRHPGYPATVCGVVYQGADRTTGCQFTFTCDGSLLRVPVAALWTRSRKIAEDALAGKVFAPIGHATHYHADYVLPYWADSLDKTVQIGRHIFYRLRSTLGDSRAFVQRYAGTEPPPPLREAVTVIPPDAVTQELANALMSDHVESISKDVEKAAAGPTSPLQIDATRGVLLADSGTTPAPVHQSTPSSNCGSGADRKQLAPLRANDMRANASANGC